MRMERHFFTIQLFTCSLMWSSGYIFMKFLVDDVDPFAISSVRAVIAAGLLGIMSMIRTVSPLPRRQELVPWLILGTFNGWLPNVLTAFALEHAPAGPSALIQASGPLFVAVMSHFAYHDERMTLRRITGIIIGLIGIATLIGPPLFYFDGATVPGLLAMVVVSLSYAAANVYAKAIPHVEPSRMALGQQVVSAIVATLLTLIIGGPVAYTPIAHSLWPMLGLSLISTALPITIFMYMIRAQGPTKASMTGYLVPALAYGLAIIFLGEAVGLRESLGGAIVLFGVYVVSTVRHIKIKREAE